MSKLTRPLVLMICLVPFVHETIRHRAIRIYGDGIARAVRLLDGIFFCSHNSDRHPSDWLLFLFDRLACHVIEQWQKIVRVSLELCISLGIIKILDKRVNQDSSTDRGMSRSSVTTSAKTWNRADRIHNT